MLLRSARDKIFGTERVINSVDVLLGMYMTRFHYIFCNDWRQQFKKEVWELNHIKG